MPLERLALSTQCGFASVANMSWIPAFELLDAGEAKLEADLAAFCGSNFLTTESSVLFAECKSFHQRLESRDVSRMKELASAFPGAVLVFASLRGELTELEKRRLRGLAAWGRQRSGDGTRNPLVVLTATELFADRGPPQCWKDHEVFGQLQSVQHLHTAPRLPRLADLTQQLHLDMVSYGDWLRDRRRHRGKAA